MSALPTVTTEQFKTEREKSWDFQRISPQSTSRLNCIDHRQKKSAIATSRGSVQKDSNNDRQREGIHCSGTAYFGSSQLGREPIHDMLDARPNLEFMFLIQDIM